MFVFIFVIGFMSIKSSSSIYTFQEELTDYEYFEEVYLDQNDYSEFSEFGSVLTEQKNNKNKQLFKNSINRCDYSPENKCNSKYSIILSLPFSID